MLWEICSGFWNRKCTSALLYLGSSFYLRFRSKQYHIDLIRWKIDIYILPSLHSNQQGLSYYLTLHLLLPIDCPHDEENSNLVRENEKIKIILWTQESILPDNSQARTKSVCWTTHPVRSYWHQWIYIQLMNWNWKKKMKILSYCLFVC